MIRIVNLQNTLNPINAQERVKINENWDELRRRLSSLQNQINFLSGGNDIEEIIQRIEMAISDAQNVTSQTQSALDNISNALQELESFMNDAGILNGQVRDALDELNLTLNNMTYRGLYDASTTYEKGNYVRLGKDSYVALKQNTGITPVDDGVNWTLVAVGGVDGSGAVSTVNGVLPDSNGNVELDYLDQNDLTTINQNLDRKANTLRPNESLNLFVATNGSDSNDGLSADNAFATVQAAFDYIKNNYSTLDGTVRIRMAPGTYVQSLFVDSILSRGRIQLIGEVDSNNVPTVIFDGTTNASLPYAMTFSSNMQVLVSNIAIRNFAGSNSRSGIVAQQHTNLWTQNVHVSNCGFAGINANVGCTLYVEGGIIENCRIGVRVYSNSIVTAGYRNPTQSYEDPNRLIIRNCTETGLLVYNMSTGHADFSEFAGNRNGITIQNSSRLHVWRNLIKNSTGYGVFVTTSSTWYDDANVYEGNVLNSKQSAFSNELSQSDYFTPLTAINPTVYLGTATHTGSTVETYFNTIDPLINHRLLANTFIRPGQHLKVIVSGTFSGSGTKTIYIRLDTGLVAGFTSTTNSVRNFKMEVDMYSTGSGSLKAVATWIEGISAYNVLISPRNLGLTTNRNLTVTATLAEAAGGVNIETFEVREVL